MKEKIVASILALQLTSPVFNHNELIPKHYTCQGADVNPPLSIQGVPLDKARSLALIVDDPDAPRGDWVHWVVFNIPPLTKEIRENTVPGLQGMNDFQKVAYGGPCPPSGTHRYFFKMFALDTMFDLPEGIRKGDLESAMQGHILAKGELVGLYSKMH